MKAGQPFGDSTGMRGVIVHPQIPKGELWIVRPGESHFYFTPDGRSARVEIKPPKLLGRITNIGTAK